MEKIDIIKNVLDFIAVDSVDDAAFNDLALKLFAYQFRNNDPFMKFARRRGKTPRTVKSWMDIPAVPINAFKTLDLPQLDLPQKAISDQTSTGRLT